MCLVLIKHKPQVAEKPILVYKMLEEYCKYGIRKDYKNIKETPFQGTRVVFKRGRTTLESNLIVEKKYYGHDVINIGIHSYELLSVANEKKEELDFFNIWGCEIYYAVIPKGSTYYLGENCEVASNKLIIFRTKEDFLKSPYVKDYEEFVEID